MITNERQYKISKTQMARFEQAIKQFNELALIEQGLDPVLVRAQRNALKSQLDELSLQIQQYEALKSGAVRSLSATAIEQLGQTLIEARIAQGLTQREFAERLQLKEQQIQRYENERYASASLTRLSEIAAALGISLQLEMNFDVLTAPSSTSQAIDAAKLPIKEMKKRKWLDFGQGKKQLFDLESLILKFMEPALQRTTPALLRKGMRLESNFDEYALLAWKARIIWRARNERPLPASNFADLSWLKTFKELTLHAEGPVLAVEYLRTKGILVLFEGHLPRTHLDGAALLVNQTPTIALTLRHDRLDNFWFVLLHELGHIVQHRESGLKEGFFDDDQVDAVEKLEKEADNFAKSVLLPAELWLSSLIRFTQSSEQIVAFAEENRISAAIIAGWIRRERNDYTIFKDLVGYGKVRKVLRKAGLLEAANVGSA